MRRRRMREKKIPRVYFLVSFFFVAKISMPYSFIIRTKTKM